MRIFRFLPGVSAAALIAAAVAPAAAQVQPADTFDIVSLEPVIVNVLRTPFPLTAAPFAVAVQGENEVQRGRPGIGLEEALGGIPGVQIDDRYNYALGDRLSIRGFGARTQFGIRGVTVLVDGIPATLPDGQTNLNHLDLSFLRRVEVIRGPASSLYGNSAGGVVQFETELPPNVPISEEVGVVAGSNGLLRMHSTTAGQAGGAAYTLNIGRVEFEGFRKEHQEAENLQVNGSLGFRGLGGDMRLVGSYVDYDALNPGSLNPAMLAANRDSVFVNNLNYQTGERGNQGQVGVTLRREVGLGNLNIAAYGITREIDNPIPMVIIDIERKAAGLSASLASDADLSMSSLQWAFGVEADVQRDDRKNYQGLADRSGNRGPLRVDQGEKVLGASVFGQLTASPMARLVAMAGLRYDATRFSVDDYFPVSATNADDTGKRTMNAISPSIGLSYEVARALSLYGNVATSFETPTTTELANQESGAGGFNPDLEPVRTLSFELGTKGEIGRRATYQLSAYRANIEDALIPFEVASSPGRSFFRNAGSAVHQGVEAGLAVIPARGLRANLAYTFLDARFDDYTIISNGAQVSLTDRRVPGVSPHRVDATLGYTAPFGLYANLEARYSDNIPVNDINTFSSPAYIVVDFRTGLEGIRVGGVTVEPFVGVTNLADEEYNTSVTVNAFGSRFFEPGPGRSFYGGGQIRFGE